MNIEKSLIDSVDIVRVVLENELGPLLVQDFRVRKNGFSYSGEARKLGKPRKLTTEERHLKIYNWSISQF